MVTVVEEVLAITIIKNMKTVPMLDFYLNKASQLSPEKNLTSFWANPKEYRLKMNKITNINKLSTEIMKMMPKKGITL